MIEIKTDNPVYQKNLENVFKTIFPDPEPEAVVLFMPPKNVEAFFKNPPDIPVLVLGGTHPDSTAELPVPITIARLTDTVRQMVERNKNTPSFETPDFIFTGATRQLIHKKSNQSFRLTEKETALLVYLYQQSPKLVSKEELLTEVCGSPMEILKIALLSVLLFIILESPNILMLHLCESLYSGK